MLTDTEKAQTMSDEGFRAEARAAEATLRRPSTAIVPAAPTGDTGAPAPRLTIRATDQADPAVAETERLKAELQRHKVEEGRLKKASDELAAARAENAEMKRKLAEADAKGADDRALGYVAPARRDIVDDDVMRGAADIARGIVAETEDRLNARFGEVEQRQNEVLQATGAAAAVGFDRQIENAFPRFIARTGAGGDLEAAWGRFLGTADPATGQPYASSIQEAHGRQRMEGVARVIQDFLRESGVARQASRLDAVVPAGSASATGGVGRGRDTNVYTTGEMDAALAEARNLYDSGTITLAARNEITSKYQAAITEGRVVRGERRV